MKAFVVSLLLAVSSSAGIIATNQTTCENYFQQKDGCVFSAASPDTRCPAPKKEYTSPIHSFALQSRSRPFKRSHLQRRYDDPEASFPIAGGKGICGSYDSKTEIGVCLWSGAEQTNPTEDTAGWLNGLNTSNCGKRIYVQRTGHPETVQYARVIDGCSFNTQALDVGCFEIGLTIELFNRFNPNEKEKADQLLYGGITWDFDNLHGQSPEQAPV